MAQDCENSEEANNEEDTDFISRNEEFNSIELNGMSQISMNMPNFDNFVTNYHSSGKRDPLITTDTAADIKKCLTILGGFRWLGCAAHHLNLIAQLAFKKSRVHQT